MNIGARITARKVVYSYIYSYIVQHNPYDNPTWELDAITDSYGVPLAGNEKTIQDLEDDDAILQYCIRIVKSFFSYRRRPQVDMQYIKAMIPAIHHTLQDIPSKVDSFASSFQFQKMDVCDQTLFVLAITEFLYMDTPKEVMINESVELAKRYGDEGSSKLVNGVLHSLLDTIEKK